MVINKNGDEEALDLDEDAEVVVDDEEIETDESDEDSEEEIDESEDDQDASEEEDGDDDDEELTPREKKLKEIADNYKRRAEKAEAKNKGKDTDTKKSENKKSNNSVKAQEITLTDQYALLRNNVHEDDVPEVLAYAKMKKIPLSEALKTNVVKAILKDSEEKRTTSKATSKGRNDGRRGTFKTPLSTLLQNAKKGIMPENDDDLDRLVNAEMALKKKRVK
jgi:hypothetical protein